MNERILNQISSLKDEVTRLTSLMVTSSVFSNVIDQQFINLFLFFTRGGVLQYESMLQTDNDTKDKSVS